MDRITILENRLNALQQAFEQAQKNNIPVTQKADSTTTLSQEIKINTDGIVENTEGIAVNEDAVCELSETTEASVAELEQAICDLSEEIHTESEAE